ncbi:hypothetical protein [Paenibacillus macerans]|uniref:Uncharacterized protein n=2 Tax=Paenibacillus macerans TaxID=44252 RepID=A0A090ZAM7_PAEMA|nr:hypothetical protein [Paenibacillus macerans]KFN08334.1 hypothetical protein DJ90_1612 [Paenibacillus macerans]MCY7557718.1 hypothetical protein [Paenibacillus macerans]MEC0152403.1 hypothetical protein [Paenibacillus macerans]SUA83634.1 Uncharacterised protein [Paenibacillus macerans]GIP12427.1 hypothetical protein J1TS5_45970 [Paenibacillus macerans]
MWPLGQYERLVYEIKRRENNEIPVIFGLLVADFHQQKCKEYILNYIERFDYKSDQYINFYLPGYLEEDLFNNDEKITIKQKDFYFNRDTYLNFLDKLEVDFKIDYPYNPVLILMEYDRGNFNRTKRIIIELDSNGSDIKQVGEMFERIFEIAKEVVSINDFSKSLMKDGLKKGLLDKIIEGIDISYITAIYKNTKEINKYRIKSVN